jgi:hypothetical protein
MGIAPFRRAPRELHAPFTRSGCGKWAGVSRTEKVPDQALIDELARCFAAAALERAFSGTNEGAIDRAKEIEGDGDEHVQAEAKRRESRR